MEIKGGCLCGSVRYTAEVDPTTATVCHCRDCQKFTGGACADLVRATKEAVTIEGTVKTFTSIGGSKALDVESSKVIDLETFVPRGAAGPLRTILEGCF